MLMAKESVGSVDTEMQIVMESYEKKVEQMRNAWVSLGEATVNSSIVKGFIDTTTEVLKLTEASGGLTTALVAVSLGFATIKFANMVRILGGVTNAWKYLTLSINTATVAQNAYNVAKLGVVGLVGTAVVAGVMQIGKGIKWLSEETKRAREEVAKLSSELQELSETKIEANTLVEQIKELEKLKETVGLTNEEYEAYYETQNSLKELIPSLKGYYDQNGNFLIQEEDLLKRVNELYDERSKKLSNDLTTNSKKVFTSDINDLKAYENQLVNIDRHLASLKAQQQQFLSFEGNMNSDDFEEGRKSYENEIAHYESLRNEVAKNLQANDAYNQKLSDSQRTILALAVSNSEWTELTKEQQQAIEEMIGTFNNSEDLENWFAIASKDTGNFIGKMKEQEFVIKRVQEMADKAKEAQMKLEESQYKAKIENMFGYKAEEVESLAQAFDEVTESLGDLDQILKDIDDENGLSAKNITILLEKYPELAQHLGDEIALREAILVKIDEEKIAQQTALQEMLASDDTYYQNKILKNEQWVNKTNEGLRKYFESLGVKYETDVKNYKNAEQAKADITTSLINQLGAKWNEYNATVYKNFTTKSIDSPIAMERFDEEAFRKSVTPTDPFTGKPKNDYISNKLVDNMVAEEKRKWEQGREQLYLRQKQMEDMKKSMSELFTFEEFKPITIQDIGGGSSSNSSSNKNNGKTSISYISSLYKEIIDEILTGSEEIQKAIDINQERLDFALFTGDTATARQLEKELEDMYLKLRDEQHAMKQQILPYLNDMKKTLSETGLFTGKDLDKLTSKDLAEVVRNLEIQAQKASETQKEVIEKQKSLIQDIGGTYIDALEQAENLSTVWWQQQNQLKKLIVENINTISEKTIEGLEREISLLELEKELLMEDSSMYNIPREQQDAQKLENINKKVLEKILAKRVAVEKQIQQLMAQGIKKESDEIKQLEDAWISYEKERLAMMKSIAEQRRSDEMGSLNKEISDIETAKNNVKTYIDLVIDMLKQETNLKKEALEEEYKAQKEQLDKLYKQEKEALDKKKKLLKEEADARKESLDKEKDDRDYERNLKEKQDKITSIENQLIALSNDNSAQGIKKRKELEMELAKYKQDLEDFLYDKSISDQKDAIDEELSNQTDKIDKELDNIESKYEEETKLAEDAYNKQKEIYEDFLNDKKALHDKANEILKNKDGELYDRLKEYVLNYTEMGEAEFVDMWTKAHNSMEVYGIGQNNVLKGMESLTAQAIKLKNELDKITNNTTYKDYLSQVGLNDKDFTIQTGGSNGETVDKVTSPEERDSVIGQMNKNSQSWSGADDEEKKRLANENIELAKKIGAWKASSKGGNEQGDTWVKDEWLIKINDIIYPLKKAIGIRHTGLETGAVMKALSKEGQLFANMLKNDEQLNILQKGEWVMTDKQMQRGYDLVTKVNNSGKNTGVNVTLDMHDFTVTKDTLPSLENMLKDKVPKILNEALKSKGIRLR